MLCVYNAGSFFNDNEIPKSARIKIYNLINNIRDLKHVIFESRPEFINDKELGLLKDIIDKTIFCLIK